MKFSKNLEKDILFLYNDNIPDHTSDKERLPSMFKINWNKSNTLMAIYACAVLILTLTGISIIVNIRFLYLAITGFFNAISPVIYALVFAYIINPLLKVTEKRLVSRLKFRKKTISPRVCRLLSLLLAYVILALLLFLVGLLVIPQIIGNYENIVNKTSDFLSYAIEKMGGFFGFGSEDASGKISEYASTLLAYLGTAGGRFALAVLKFLLGLFISFFVLFYKEKLIASVKKLLASILPARFFNRTMSITRLTDRTFGRFFIGKIFDSLIIGVLAFIVFWIARMPYYPLLAVIVCITNVIPYFGPIIGAVPCVVLVLIEGGVPRALAVAIIILVIQQLDGNVIGPKILGSATGLSSLWVVVSITVMGSFFGFVGMVIGVPLFSVLYTIIKEHTEKRLERRGLPTETEAYSEQNPIDLLEESAKRRAENAPAPALLSDQFEELYLSDPDFDFSSYFDTAEPTAISVGETAAADSAEVSEAYGSERTEKEADDEV